MYYNYRVWLINDNKDKIIGRGPIMLLKKTDELGSLNKAALEMNMSYTKAYSLIKNAEKSLSVKLLIKQIGGKYGGGSIVTAEAKDIIKKYEEFDRRAGESVERLYNEIF